MAPSASRRPGMRRTSCEACSGDERSGREDGSDWVLGHREPDLLMK